MDAGVMSHSPQMAKQEDEGSSFPIFLQFLMQDKALRSKNIAAI
jgi:hypothetical protein